MEQLSKIQTILFVLGGSLMVVGAGGFAFAFVWPQVLMVVCWLFLVGAVLFATMQLQQTYAGHSTVIKRLKRIQSLADLFFVLAGLSMVDTVFQFFRPLFTDYFSYYTYVYNKWVVLMLIAAALELYTVHRIGTELKHEESVSDEQP